MKGRGRMDKILGNSLGNWKGTKKIWLAPDNKCRECDLTAEISDTSLGRCGVINYSWSFASEPQEGLLLLNTDFGKGNIQAAWVDSFHMANGIMILDGGFTDKNTIDLIGKYSSPPGPDWSWRIVISFVDKNTMKLTNYNVTPDGIEQLAIEAILHTE